MFRPKSGHSRPHGESATAGTDSSMCVCVCVFSQIMATADGVGGLAATGSADGNDDERGGAADDADPGADPAARDRNERMFRQLMPDYQQREPMSCELCGDTFATPVAFHMGTTHPGCGYNSGGRGYTSNGTYSTGWSGVCGEGGIDGSPWYLLCETCRNNYLRRAKPTAAAAARSRKTAVVSRTRRTGDGSSRQGECARIRRGNPNEAPKIAFSNEFSLDSKRSYEIALSRRSRVYVS